MHGSTRAVLVFFVAAVIVAAGWIGRAGAEDRRGNAAGTYSYHPAGSQGAPELCDTRTGTIYRRNISGTWEVASKLPD